MNRIETLSVSGVIHMNKPWTQGWMTALVALALLTGCGRADAAGSQAGASADSTSSVRGGTTSGQQTQHGNEADSGSHPDAVDAGPTPSRGTHDQTSSADGMPSQRSAASMRQKTLSSAQRSKVDQTVHQLLSTINQLH
jgi:hypothetical protein